jgi:hypothetical protein
VSFSRLLLAAASSKKFISGEGNDKIVISPKISLAGRDAYEGEVILCFQLDDRRDGERRVARSLGLQTGNPRCDGLIFYARDEDEDKVICLIEMKSTNIADAAGQIISIKRHIETLLHEEYSVLPQGFHADCRRQISHIRWKAGIFHHGSSPQMENAIDELRREGFNDVRPFTSANNDARKLLTGEESVREMAKKYKPGKQRHGRR